MRSSLWAALVLGACAGDAPSGDAPAPTSETGAVTDTDTTGDTDTGTEVSAPGVSGVLLAPDGQPLAHEEVLCCQTSYCAKGDTDAQGAFHFEVTPGTKVAVKTHHDLYQSPRWGSALVPAEVPAGGAIDIGELYTPDLPVGMPLGDESEDPQTLSVGDDLELTLNRGDLQADLGVVLYDVAARRLPDAHVPAYAELDGATVVAVYALHPFATESSSPVGVRAPAKLADGTPVSFRSISHLDGTFSEPASGQAQGGQVTTDPGQGIELLTHLVITTP